MAPPIRWFYVAEGRRQGPVDVNRLVELILSGTVPDDTLVWYAGQPDWVPARRIAEIAKELPPPLPGAAPAPLDAVIPRPGELATGASPAPEAAAADPTTAAGHERHHRHRHKRHRYVVITSPWWRRWMIPFLLALVALGLFLWLYLMHINQPAPPEVYTEPTAELRALPPACG